MLGTLIESMGSPQRRAGGTVTSFLAHAVLIGGAVAVTARQKSAPTPPSVASATVHYVLPVESPPQTRVPRRVADASSIAAVPSLPALQVPSIIPTGIPAIDFNGPATPTDFDDIRSHDAGNGCAVVCAPHGADTSTQTWADNDAIMRLREQVVPPRYPDQLRRVGIEGRVVVKFIVDTLGRVDPKTIEVLESSHDLFTAAVRETLVRLRFTPAMAGSRKVPAAAMMPFEFRLK
jgi:protein TonB